MAPPCRRNYPDRRSHELRASSLSQAITWTPANPMNKARGFFTATKLLNGDVLVAGGYDSTADPFIFPDADCEHVISVQTVGRNTIITLEETACFHGTIRGNVGWH